MRLDEFYARVHRWSVVVAGCLLLLVLVTGLESHAAERPPVGITLLPHGNAFTSFAEYGQDLQFDFSTYDDTAIRTAEIEIRRAKDNLRLLRFPYTWRLNNPHLKDERPVRHEGWSPKLSPQVLRRLRDVPPGEYQLAIYLNGVRASNVASVRIDPAFDVKAAPTLRWATIEPHPLAKDAAIALWVVGPTPMDPKLTNLGVYASPIVVDGIQRVRKVMAISGMISAYPSGHRSCLLMNVQGYEPEITPGAPHEFVMKIGEREAAPFRFDPRVIALATAWEEQGLKLVDQPLPVPGLTGRITGNDGKPAAGYVVGLAKQGSRQAEEYTDEEGRYAFVNVPSGEYSVHASPPPPAGSPFVSREHVQISEGLTATCDLTFAKEYQISGTVVDESGRPVARVPVNATWTDEASNSEFGSTTNTADDGSFTLRGPFRKISFVGIATNLWRSDPHHNVKAGAKKVNFVVRKP